MFAYVFYILYYWQMEFIEFLRKYIFLNYIIINIGNNRQCKFIIFFGIELNDEWCFAYIKIVEKSDKQISWMWWIK